MFVPGLVLVLATMSPARGASTCNPPARLDDGWEIATPVEVDMDDTALCALLAGVAAGRDNVHGVVVVRRGRLVAEVYRRGPDRPIDRLYGLWNPSPFDGEFGPQTLHDVRSISKSVVDLLLGIARARGWIGSLETPALDFFPALADLRSPARDAITLATLLTMSSGLEWDEGGLPNDETSLYWKSDPDRFVLDRPLIATPGTVFHYNSGGTAVLADILARVSGEKLEDLARRELFEPLGIREWEWIADLHGRPLAFTGLRLRPRDLAKLGRLVLDRGQWDGKTVVPADWIDESLRPHIATGFHSPPASPYELEYGYFWWAGRTDWHGEPVRWAAGFGNGGQRLFVVPRLDLAVAVAAGDYGDVAIGHVVNRLFGQIVETVRADGDRAPGSD